MSCKIIVCFLDVVVIPIHTIIFKQQRRLTFWTCNVIIVLKSSGVFSFEMMSSSFSVYFTGIILNVSELVLHQHQVHPVVTGSSSTPPCPKTQGLWTKTASSSAPGITPWQLVNDTQANSAINKYINFFMLLIVFNVKELVSAGSFQHCVSDRTRTYKPKALGLKPNVFTISPLRQTVLLEKLTECLDWRFIIALQSCQLWILAGECCNL